MKKNLLILCSLLIGMTFVACSSDDDDNNGNSSASDTSVKSFANFSIVYGGETMFSCEYDEKGRLIHCKESGEDWTVTYNNGNQPTKIFYTEDDDYTVTYTSITTNKQGYITSMKGEHVFAGKASYDNYSSTLYFDYDGNGYLVKMRGVLVDKEGSWEDVVSYTWSNGNLVGVKRWENETKATDDGPYEYEKLITYGEDVNKLEQGSYSLFYSGGIDRGDGWIWFTNLFGKHSKNLPISYKSITRGKYKDEDETTFEYEFNSDGSIKTEMVNGYKLEYVYGN